jgi:diguanylate cyclase (GGDEF)-like protein
MRSRRPHLILLELAGSELGAVHSVGAASLVIGRSARAGVSLADDGIATEHARMTRTPDGVYLQDLCSSTGTFVNEQRIHALTELADGDYLRFGPRSVLKFSSVSELEERAHRSLFELTLRDPLTRSYNRRYFDACLLSEFAFAQRHRSELAVLMIDIDHFKLVNDSCGHQVSDAVLKLVASSIQIMMRPEDVLARYGGEEFVVLLRATSARNMEILGQRLCRHIAALQLNLVARPLGITVSIGASHMCVEQPCTTSEALLRAADLALFSAKAQGRNRTVAAPCVR